MDWFALTVKPQHERVAAEHLLGRSLEAYVPFCRSKRRWSDRVKVVDAPLFPRYVFCRFSFDDRFKVLRMPSVTAIVGFGGTPCPVSEKEIEAVKRIAGSGLPMMPWPLLRIGQQVRICQGPLSGLEGILAKEKTDYKVVVNIEILQRAVAVEIERDVLEGVTAPQRTPFQDILVAPIIR
jgi:transcriptional antiterminator NusG